MDDVNRRFSGCLLLSAILHGTVLAGFAPAQRQDRLPVLSILQMRLQRVQMPAGEASQPDIDIPASRSLHPDIATADEDEDEDEGALSSDDPVQSPQLALPVEHYYKSSELDRQPHPLEPVQPVYPANAEATAQEGWVRLLLWIDENGKVRNAEVVEADPRAIFDEAAITAFRNAAFEPGRRAGVPVKSRMLLRVNFAQGQEMNPL